MDRLTKLERRAAFLKGIPLVVLAETPAGEVIETDVDTMIQEGYGFLRVIDGSSLKDFDKILEQIRKNAEG